MAPRGLGRGLDSLIPASARVERSAPAVESSTKQSDNEILVLPVSKIKIGRYQPRQTFKEESLKELADSIREQGLIQPLIVTPARNGSAGVKEYELIAGERRWRASQMAGLTEVPVVVRKVTEKEQFQISLIENIQREDLNAIEEAQAFKRLMEEFNLTQEELAKSVGKGRVVIANSLRLLNLPAELQDSVANGMISPGHARNLVSIDDDEMQKEISDRILNEHLTVREVEKIVADWRSAVAEGRIKTPTKKDPEMRHLEETLQKILATKVEIQTKGKGKEIRGSVRIAYYSLDDLERLVAFLKKG